MIKKSIKPLIYKLYKTKYKSNKNSYFPLSNAIFILSDLCNYVKFFKNNKNERIFMKLNLKKGAMFGLDARIALAIFGALSVISGAALYNAIKDAKTEQLNQYFVEHTKALEQYFLDNGAYTPMMGATTYVTMLSDLISNSANHNTWKGPYIDGTVSANGIKDTLTASINSASHLQSMLLIGTDWSSNTSMQACASIGNHDCYEYFVLYSGNTAAGVTTITDMFNRLDEKIDNSDGALAGKIRYINRSSNDDFLAYKTIPRKRTQ